MVDEAQGGTTAAEVVERTRWRVEAESGPYGYQVVKVFGVFEPRPPVSQAALERVARRMEEALNAG